MDLPVIFSKGWFIYLRKLVLALKHTPPPPPLDRIDQKIWHVLKNQPCDIGLPLPHPRLFNTHTPTCIHSLGFPLWGGIGGSPYYSTNWLVPPCSFWPFCSKCSPPSKDRCQNNNGSLAKKNIKLSVNSCFCSTVFFR